MIARKTLESKATRLLCFLLSSLPGDGKSRIVVCLALSPSSRSQLSHRIPLRLSLSANRIMAQLRLSNRLQTSRSRPSNHCSPPPPTAVAPASRDAAVEIASSAQVSQQDCSPSSSAHGRRHDLRGGAARGTRSGNQETLSGFEWEALDLARSKSSPVGASSTPTGPVRSSAGVVSALASVSNQPDPKPRLTLKMSRNRPRAPRDNGVAATEETELWTKIVGDLKRAQEKNDRQKVLAEQIRALNEKVGMQSRKFWSNA